MIQLSIFFRYLLLLIPQRKRLLGARRIRRTESGTPSTITPVCDTAIGITDLGVMFLWPIGVHNDSSADFFELYSPADFKCRVL